MMWHGPNAVSLFFSFIIQKNYWRVSFYLHCSRHMLTTHQFDPSTFFTHIIMLLWTGYYQVHFKHSPQVWCSVHCSPWTRGQNNLPQNIWGVLQRIPVIRQEYSAVQRLVIPAQMVFAKLCVRAYIILTQCKGMYHSLTCRETDENIDIVFRDAISWVEKRI